MDLASRIATMITRAKVISAGYAANGVRVMVQALGFNGAVSNVEILLPYGYSAMPVGQLGDLLMFQIAGTPDHKVSIGADDGSCRITDLQPGELGLQDNQGQQVAIRRGAITLKSGLKIELTAPVIHINGTAELVYESGGNGVKLTPNSIDAYQQGATSTSNPLNPPAIPE